MGCSSRIFNDKNCTNYAAPRDTNSLRTLEMGKGLDLLGLMIPTFCLYFSIFCRLHRGVAAPLDWVAFACDRGFYSQPPAAGSIDRLILMALWWFLMELWWIMFMRQVLAFSRRKTMSERFLWCLRPKEDLLKQLNCWWAAWSDACGAFPVAGWMSI